MSHGGTTNTSQRMVVLSAAEEWLSLKSLLQDNCERKHVQFSLGSSQVCDLAVDGHSISLRCADLKEEVTEEDISQAVDGCFKSCTGGIVTFLLLIQGGFYAKTQRRMVETLQAHFGAEALKYLVVLSLEDGEVADTLEDALLELINACEGRYCRVTSSNATDKLQALFEMVDYMLAENGASGYTDAALTEARKRSAEDSAAMMLKRKMQEAEQKEQAFKRLAQEQEERRAKEMKGLKKKHAEEREREAAECKQYEAKRESLEEAVTSHRAMWQLHERAADDDDTKKVSIVLLGLSGSGKTSALNLILDRAGNQYSASGSDPEPPQPTVSCERKEVFAAGKPLVLVDTPELWDEDGVEDLEQVKDCLALSLPGPHVFLLVLQVGRFTQGESEMLGRLQKVFGRDFAEHAVVLFVRLDCDRRGPQSIDDYVTGAHAALQGLIQKCGSRYYELNLTKSQNALSYPQVKDLLCGIRKLVASHGGRSLSVRRFSVKELQERKKMIEEGKEGALEGNYLLRDA